MMRTCRLLLLLFLSPACLVQATTTSSPTKNVASTLKKSLHGKPVVVSSTNPFSRKNVTPSSLPTHHASSSSSSSLSSPSKWQNVWQRTVPAVLMLTFLAAWIQYFGTDGMMALVIVIQLGLYAEASAVLGLHKADRWWWFLTVLIGTSGRLLWKHHTSQVDLLTYAMGVTSLVAFVLQQNSQGSGPETFRTNLSQMAASHLALLLLLGQSSFWIATLQTHGLLWVLYPAFLVMINDTMAYVFGMICGRHALLPVISPKKTWEGFVGATLSTLGVSVPLLHWMTNNNDQSSLSLSSLQQHALAIATFVSLIAPFGGFLASVVKRAHGQKDFGKWIPGHGGVVDRLDCQVVTAPFVYLYLQQCL